MKLIKWAVQVQDRFRWKDIVGKAQTTRVVAPQKKKTKEPASTLIEEPIAKPEVNIYAHLSVHRESIIKNVPTR
jgi:hypothetical protein